MDEFRDLWQNQEVEQVKISTEELRAKASKFQKRIRWRNVREYVAGWIVVVWFGFQAVRATTVIPRISFGLIVAGALYIVWYMHTRGQARGLPPDMGRETCVEFHRRELERQRDLLRDIWKWYLGPLLPGLALLVIWQIVHVRPERRWYSVTYGVLCAVLFWGVGLLNRRAARRLDRQIDELKSLGG